ncbi:hypothetical protein ALC62_07922, partial [Cyphomyrmex costatus]
RTESVEDDLGLSGPVVAAFESYWPAKSQVVFGVSAKTLVSLRKKLSPAIISLNIKANISISEIQR